MQSEIDDLRNRILRESKDVILKSNSAVVNSNDELKRELDTVKNKLSSDVTKIQADLYGSKSEIEQTVSKLRLPRNLFRIIKPDWVDNNKNLWQIRNSYHKITVNQKIKISRNQFGSNLVSLNQTFSGIKGNFSTEIQKLHAQNLKAESQVNLTDLNIITLREGLFYGVDIVKEIMLWWFRNFPFKVSICFSFRA